MTKSEFLSGAPFRHKSCQHRRFVYVANKPYSDGDICGHISELEYFGDQHYHANIKQLTETDIQTFSCMMGGEIV